ncbi:hypothetical protein NXS19_008360 [Fusarium pseudograminearum]|uniref:Uncharacterized protein n=1 Tax=Fusarium pseudograminearum (strain CS3096) TaxID=1028729 RepID=K3VLQ3_FUSPC|nr:hypothetical protein FPSE_04017 [Fusarium pseudograminearum CS3096]EKJ75837.1 hypothetical protein FPSE_04017 [Fusarium pseudograminearum CS3096]UZP40544.1 hypothetical protein NXS19_008360 [Fusarium pseudograminearum]
MTPTSSVSSTAAANTNTSKAATAIAPTDASNAVTESARTNAIQAVATAASDTANGGTSTSHPKNKGLNDGEVAGVAIGCLIAGLIIGAIIGWLIFRSKGQHRYARQRRRSEDRGRLVDHPREANAVPLGISGDPMKLENIILQPTPDQDILSGLRRLEDIIRQHVETVYHLKPVDVEEKALARALADAGYSGSRSGIDFETVAGWCIETDTRCGALRHVLSNILFSAIDWNTPGPLTLLPKSAVAFMSSIRRNEKHRDNFDVMSFAWTRWRTLSALFMHPAPQERTPLEVSEPDIRDQGEALAEALDPVLHYFVAPDDESQHQQGDHLRLMIIETAQLGYTLFSHTSDWRFLYKDRSAKRRPVVCVGLEKLNGLDGHRFSSPQRIVEPHLIS